MATTRLTNKLRDIIREKAVRDLELKAVEARDEAVKRATSVIESTLKPYEKLAKALPEFCTEEESYVDLRVSLSSYGKDNFYLDSPLTLPRSSYRGFRDIKRKAVETDKEMIKLRKAWHQASNRYYDADTAVTTLLKSVNTLKQLREVWPEGEEFYKSNDTQSFAVVAIDASKVNELIGLPK